MTPWNDYDKKIYHPSSFCYYGNYGEEPSNEEEVKKIIYMNLSSKEV